MIPKDGTATNRNHAGSGRGAKGASLGPFDRVVVGGLILWALAFTHRLFFQLGSVDRGWPFPVFYEGDAETFYHYAMSLLRGQPYDGGIPFHPPLFPGLLALLHGLLGNPAPHLVLRIVLAAIHAVQVPLLWLLLRRFLTPGAALAGALLAAWSFGLSLLATAAVSEGLYLLLLTAALLLFVDLDAAAPAHATRVGPGRPLLLGLLLGLLSLTRAEGIGLALALLVLGTWRAGRSAPRVRLRPWGLAAAAVALTLAPWTVRNGVTLTRVNASTKAAGLEPLPTFVVTTAYGPLNFALANHEGAPGYFSRSLLTSGLQQSRLDLHDPQHRRAFLHGYKDGAAFIGREPRAFGALVLRKWSLLARSLRLGWTQWNLPGGRSGTRYPVDLMTPDNPAAVPVHLVLLAIGAWILTTGRAGQVSRRGRAWLGLTALLFGLTLLATAAFFGYARQGALLLPFLGGIEGVAVAAGAGLLHARLFASGREADSARPGRRSGRILLGVLALVWLLELGGAFQDRDYIASGETEAGSKMLNRDSIMRIVPR